MLFKIFNFIILFVVFLKLSTRMYIVCIYTLCRYVYIMILIVFDSTIYVVVRTLDHWNMLLNPINTYFGKLYLCIIVLQFF